MRSASARLVAAGLLLAAAPGCGLFASRLEAPPPAVVRAARRTEAAEWERLGEAAALYRERGPGALPGLREMAAAAPDFVRLQILVEDVELEQDGREKTWNRYVLRHAREPTALNALLAARAAPDRESMASLARMALARDPGLVQAQVFLMGLSARVGDPSVLDELLELLRARPGLAEGWRLLGRLAPVYGRADLAAAAAATEPWSPVEETGRAALLQAVTLLQAGNPGGALRVLEGLPEDSREAALLRARALLEAGRLKAAQDQLERLLAEDPRDAQAHFDLALLAQDYLKDPSLAREHFGTFLRLAREGIKVPYPRQLQAELWMEALDPDSEPSPILLGGSQEGE